MALRKCACIDTLYTERDWLDRFQAAKNDGFEAVEFWDWRIRDLDATREAAEKAGIQAGDIIIGVNGESVSTDAELNKKKDEHNAGDTITLNISRNGADINIDVTLEEVTQGDQIFGGSESTQN